MPAGFYAPSSEIEPVVGIQICVFSPDEIERRSVVEVTNSGTYEGNEPKIGGLFDPRMGVLDNGKECRSCGQTNHKCPGHFGHFRLARPVYYIQFLPFIQNVLSCVCIRCSKLLVDKSFRKHFLKRKGEARWRDVLTASKEIKRCGQETEDGCGARQPTRYIREGIARIVAEWDSIDSASTAEDASKSGKQSQPLEVEFVLRLFRRILDEDVDFMGLSRYWCRPDWMICTVLPIPPPQVRPSVIQDNNQRSEDDLTHKLAEIIKTNNTYLQPRIQANAAKSVIDEWTNVLQYHIATLVDNQIPGVAPSAQRNGRPLKSIQQRLGSKEGRIRYNIQGKRVEFSARSVITPDPNISIAELGVPEKIAMNLTRPERVTEFNRQKLYKFVQNGPNVFPGAKTIRRGLDGRIVSLRHVNTKDVVLHYGDIVNRHLMDGDIVLFNRQPTLHRMSMMAHKVKVLKYKTFRLNVSVTAPYNADFDGDEMNMHCPQSYEAATELEEIAAVPHQILRPRDGLPVIGVVQDTLVGSYRLTRQHVKFNRREFMNLMMWNRRFDGTVPEGKSDDGRWTGHQVLSQLMPAINMDMMNSSKKKVVIRDGEVLEGQFDKSTFSKASKGIIHMTYNDYGSKQTVDLLDAMQNTIEQFLIYNGFSVGISDLIADSATKDEMNVKIQEKKSDVETILLSIHQDLFDNNTGKTNQAEFEDKIFGILNKATELSGEIGYNSLANENRMTAMVRAGSKGGPINIAQMIACVGQQNIEGKRIPYGFEDRTLPHFKKYDDGAEARGFIQNSFINGLTPTEFFFHAMSGREGLIDTAVKSVTGDTKIVVIENGVSKCVAIGDWVDGHLAGKEKETEFFESENNLEILQLASDTYIPTVTPEGKVSWGKVAAVTRHDPGQQLYEVKTLGGRSVIVPESKSLLVWDSTSKTFEKMDTPSVRPGHCMPVTMKLSEPPVIYESIPLSNYLPKSSYIYGTDFQAAEVAVNEAMLEREHIPSGWWANANGKAFTLPYDSKARFVRTLSRSKTDNILPGYVYPFTTNRDHARIPESFTLDSDNGRFLGLFLAEGNVDVKSGYIAITNNNPSITQFVHDWFENQRVRSSEVVKLNAIGGVTTTVRGYSTLLAKFFDLLAGHGAANKRVPAEAFAAPTPFIVGLLDGYFSGDGTVSTNSVEAGSASKELIEGISMLCSRLGIFAKIFETQLLSNNIGTENILPTYRISIRAQWAAAFAKAVTLIDGDKNTKLMNLKASLEHRNFPFQNDVVLDEIVEINLVSVDAYPKLYDLTVPETFTFGLANGLQVYDTADTGYIQRQLVKAMEDLVVQHDGTVRDANMNIAQFHYGEDGINSTKIESQTLEFSKLSREDIARDYGLEGVDLMPVLADGLDRGDDKVALKEFAEQVRADQKMVVEGVFRSGNQGQMFSAVNLDRLLLNMKIKFGLNDQVKTNLTPLRVLAGIEAVLDKTQRFHKMWAALLRYTMSPLKMIVKERFTESAFDTLCELLVTKNWQAWVQPGEQVGIIAAQSIGEPSTQMSASRHTFVQVVKVGGNFTGPVGEFIDKIIADNAEHVTTIGKDSVVLDLSEDCYIMGVSNDEKTSWKRISQVSRHPANGGLVKVTTKSGRSTTATLTHSFLKRTEKGVEPILGSDLTVGMRVPIATKVDQVPMSLITEHSGFTLDKDFGWLCGIYLADGSFMGNTVSICKIHPIVEESIRHMASKYGWKITVRNYEGEYGPSKNTNIHSKELRDFLNAEFKTGSYEKTIGPITYSAPKEFQHGLLSGYFDGDGNVNGERHQIRAGSRSQELIRHINRLFSYAGFFSVMSEEASIRIPDKVFYTVNVLKKYAAEFKERIGFRLTEKAEALDEIIAYMARPATLKHDTKELYDKIPAVGRQIAAIGKALELPGQSRNYGRWLKKESVGRQTLKNYVEIFEAAAAEKPHVDVSKDLAALKSAAFSDVIWDEITNLEYLADPKEFVYDFTVPGNDSFMVDDAILVHNTLNSVDWDTKVMIAKNGEIICPEIGEFIDAHLAANANDVKVYANNQEYLDLNDGNDWQAISCDEDGKMMWTKLEAVTRHPVVNEDGTNTILEVETESGRITKATKGKSFLTLIDGKVKEINGSELKVGDVLPIANSLAIEELGLIEKITLRKYLPPTEWLYGTDVNLALVQLQGQERHWFQKNNGNLFTIPYSRSDAFREAFIDGKNTNAENILPGFVYPARTRPDVSQIPDEIPLTQEFGFFAGAYVAEGMANTTQVNITNNDTEYLEKVQKLMNTWNVGTHMVSEKRDCVKTGIKGTSTSLVIHSTLLATLMQKIFGRVSGEKTLPDWVFQAPHPFVQGLVDGYISGDGSIEKKSGSVHATSVSKDLLTRFSTLFARYGIFGRISSHMPEQGKFDSVRMAYTLTLPAHYSKLFADNFNLSLGYKQEILDYHFGLMEKGQESRREMTGEVIWDAIKSIKEIIPIKEKVYDFTVDATKNFMTYSCHLVRDTFHLAGVASKSNVTRGVPRLKELLKVTQNPKAVSLTIPLKKEYQNSKAKAREVSQELELTLLRDMTIKTAIYFDPKDNDTVLKEDRELLAFYKMFEQDTPAQEGVWSKYILRLEFNRQNMFDKNITMDDILFVLRRRFEDEVQMVYSDFNSQKLIMRIRLSEESLTTSGDPASLDALASYKKFQNKLLNAVIIRGLPGIKAATFRKGSERLSYNQEEGKYKTSEEYILDTDGSNFLEVMNHPAVDATRVTSTHVHDVYPLLGIEATRHTLYTEITTLFEDGQINYRHLGLLVDVMTRAGRLMSVDRYGINKLDIGPLAKASFEETERILLKAAVFGEIDPVTGVSANIMTGQPIRGGTAFSDILLDEVALLRLQKGLPPVGDYATGREAPATEDDAPEAPTDDFCSPSRLRMNLTLPTTKANLTSEPDIDFVELEE